MRVVYVYNVRRCVFRSNEFVPFYYHDCGLIIRSALYMLNQTLFPFHHGQIIGLLWFWITNICIWWAFIENKKKQSQQFSVCVCVHVIEGAGEYEWMRLIEMEKHDL